MRLLTRAAATLRQCEALESAQVLAAEAPAVTGERRSRPAPPLILSRSCTTMDVSHFPLHLKGGPATHFAVYCKPFGAGVELSINATAMQYEGTGVKVPAGTRVTVQGLRPNDTYMFAVAAFDKHGRLVGGLGASQNVGHSALMVPAAWSPP
jgi:hypothetical protein